MKVSQRLHNNTYAPGIATYGIQGKTGKTGEPGAGMFFTDYNIDTDIFNGFAQKITSRKLPLQHEEVILNRNYINGDTFVTKDGNIYMLMDISTLSTTYANGGNISGIDVTSILQKIGEFNKQDTIFEDNTICSSTLIITDNPNDTENDTNSLLRLNHMNNNTGAISFINLNALYSNSANINLDIQYDNTLRAFIFKSQYPIVLDANTFVKYDNQLNQLADYSPVITKDNNITNFYGICSHVKYTLDTSIFNYTKPKDNTIYFGCIYKVNLQVDEDYKNILQNYITTYDTSALTIHIQNGNYQDYQLYRNIESTYHFRQDYDIVNQNAMINTVNNDIKNIYVSLIDNIEVFLNKIEN